MHPAVQSYRIQQHPVQSGGQHNLTASAIRCMASTHASLIDTTSASDRALRSWFMEAKNKQSFESVLISQKLNYLPVRLLINFLNNKINRRVGNWRDGKTWPVVTRPVQKSTVRRQSQQFVRNCPRPATVGPAECDKQVLTLRPH